MPAQHQTRTHKKMLLPLLWLSGFCLHGMVDAATTATTEHTHIRLLSEQQHIQPDQHSFWLALQLTPEPGWHTYWINPGDAGKATEIQWQLPSGMQAGPIHWPYPQRIRTGSLVSFGYMGTVTLLTEIIIGRLAPDTRHIEISAIANWLVCEEICIPENASLTLKLPINTDPTSADTATHAIFHATRARLPVVSNQPAQYAYKNNQLVIDMPVQTTNDLETVLFFPVADNLIENSSSQSFLLGSDTLRLSVGAGYLKHSAPLQAVLVLQNRNSEIVQALEFIAHPVQQLPVLEMEPMQPGNRHKPLTD